MTACLTVVAGGSLLRSYAFFDPADVFRLYPTVVVVSVVTFYVAVIFLGTVGNILVIFVVVRRPEMWTATNVLIANLAFADVFVCSFALPVSLYHQLMADWMFGSAMCRAIPTVYGIVVCASTLTLTAIAVDRYILIVFPMTVKMSTRAAVCLVVVIALSSVLVALPIAVFSQYRVVADTELRFARRLCVERWPSKEARKTYTVLTVVVQYFAPLLLIAVLYSRIFRRVRSRIGGGGGGGGSSSLSKSGASRRRRRRRTNVMLVAVVAVFAVAWTPYQLFSVIFEFRRGLVVGRYFVLGDLVLRAIAMSSSCINPFLYGWLNENFRSAFVDILGRFLPIRGGKSTSGSTGRAPIGCRGRPKKSNQPERRRRSIDKTDNNGSRYVDGDLRPATGRFLLPEDGVDGRRSRLVRWTSRLTASSDVRHELTIFTAPKLSDFDRSDNKLVVNEQLL